MIKTVFYFRKPLTGFHSFEELFGSIMKHLPGDILPQKQTMPCSSKGIILRLINIFIAPFHQQEVNHITGDVHYIAFLMKKRKTILTIHDLEIVKRSNPVVKRIILFFWFYLPSLRVRYITVISEFTKMELLKYISIPPKKIKVIHDCIPGEIAFTPQPFHSACPVILHIGTKPNKNLPALIAAIKGLTCKLIIIGKLETDQKRLLQNASVVYENYFDLTYDEVIEQYRKSDLLSFVSTYEGFGLPILEAQAIGRPVVTSNLSSMPEVAGEGALLVDPNDPSSIRQGIENILHDGELRERLIQAGRENVKHFQPAAIAEKYAEIYREIVKWRG